MEELLSGIAQILGLSWLAAKAPKQRPFPPVSIGVSALVFGLLGALLGPLVRLAFPALSTAIALAATLVALLAIGALTIAVGVKPGFSLSRLALACYAVAFCAGAIGTLSLLSAASTH